VVAAGHRIVHGADRYSAPVLLTEALLAELAGFVPLAPLHQPHNLAAVEALAALAPDLPQVGCFDTAFHRTQPALAQAFALPRALSAEGIKRYGFHGLSYEYIAGVLPQHLGPAAEGRVVVAHLGNGASMCGMIGRRSAATTMGFTALDGLMMGTRAGNLDPGVLLYLIQHKGMDVERLTRLLYKESGLLGVSDLSQDMRTLLASDRPAAREAIELFCYRATRELGSLAAALGGLDALVFTGGIGERAAPVRARICTAAAWLGLSLDEAANATNATVISAAESRVAVLVVPTDEERMIAQHTVALLRRA
jgi:acetate kinase